MASRARAAPPRRLLEALGITRVARVTGLDRTGVEVACAVRPLGHVLQVCNGKGASWTDAAWGAVSEAAELATAESLDPTLLRLASAEEMRRHFGASAVWGPSDFGSDDRLGRCSWIALERLDVKGTVWAPAAIVHCPPRGAPLFGLPGLSWTSNGAAAHVDAELALRHALLELIERDQLARSLPEGWTQAALKSRRLVVDAGPLAGVVASLEGKGFLVVLADLVPKRALGVPIVGALLLDLERGPVPLAAGYAAAATPEAAALAALREAAQSRLTDIHGAREDVEPMAEADVEMLAGWIARAKPRRTLNDLPKLSASEQRAKSLIARLAGARIPTACIRWQVAGLEVVKVLAPGLLRSELL